MLVRFLVLAYFVQEGKVHGCGSEEDDINTNRIYQISCYQIGYDSWSPIYVYRVSHSEYDAIIKTANATAFRALFSCFQRSCFFRGPENTIVKVEANCAEEAAIRCQALGTFLYIRRENLTSRRFSI